MGKKLCGKPKVNFLRIWSLKKKNKFLKIYVYKISYNFLNFIKRKTENGVTVGKKMDFKNDCS